MSDDAVIDVSGVVKRFGSLPPVLDGIDLRVGRGEIVAIGGPSGSGKSTLLHLLAALDEPDAGRIVIDGRDVSRRPHLDRFRRNEIGIVFQLHHLLPHLNAERNVEIAMFGTGRRSSDRRAKALALLEELALNKVSTSKPPELSGGERQRVAVARALANEPAVILADEPTGSLDDETSGMVLGALERARASRDATVVLVTHDERASRIADRQLWLAAGSIADH
jgi:ABC-type lipoprotein export system ATPase subunit